MAKNFKELQAKMSRDARIRSEEAAQKMISEMGLAELREAMDLTQESLADTLHVPAIVIERYLFSGRFSGYPQTDSQLECQQSFAQRLNPPTESESRRFLKPMKQSGHPRNQLVIRPRSEMLRQFQLEWFPYTRLHSYSPQAVPNPLTRERRSFV